MSFLFEFKDGGNPIRVAYTGGTAISFTNSDPAYYDQYIASAQKFAMAAAAFGATALMSNHTEFDNAYFKAHTAAYHRIAGSKASRELIPNPYDVGQRAVMGYMGVVELCAMSAKLRATGSL